MNNEYKIKIIIIKKRNRIINIKTNFIFNKSFISSLINSIILIIFEFLKQFKEIYEKISLIYSINILIIMKKILSFTKLEMLINSFWIKNKNKNISLKNQKRTINLLSALIFLTLINIISADNSNSAELNSTSIIYLKVKGKNSQKIINKNFISNCLVYYNGDIIDFNGTIFLDNNNNNNLTLIWKNKLNTSEYLFQDSESIIEIDLSKFDTSEITSMGGMFNGCINLQYINFSNIDTSSVTNMNIMFQNCHSLTSLDLSHFNTSKVKEMQGMFFQCKSIVSLNLSNFNTSNLYYMNYMFYYCSSLREIDFTNINTTNVITMKYLFAYCKKLISINLNNFDVKNVSNFDGMFLLCESLTYVNLSNWQINKAYNLSYMFYGCYSLISIDLPYFPQKEIRDMKYMFSFCKSLKEIDLTNVIINNSYINRFFYSCESLKTIKFPKYLIKPISIFEMFFKCSSLLSIDFNNFNFSLIVDYGYLFYQCTSLISMDLSNIKTLKPELMDYMFYGCNSLKFVDLSNLKTNKLNSISYMFYGCTSLININLTNFDTSSVTIMKYAFANCMQLTSLNLESFITTKVSDMQSMFYGCASLLSINLSNFNTSEVKNMKSMFFSCVELTSLDLSNFNFEKTKYMSSMFSGCTNLIYLNIYNYNDDFSPSIQNLFFETSYNMTIVINKESNIENFKSELSSLKCIINNSSIKYEKRKRKIIYDNRYCVDDCQKNEIYKYEFDNFCYKNCPFGTHSNINNSYLCEENYVECSDNFPFLNLLDNSCTDMCYAEDFFNKKCSLNKNNIEKKEILILNIKKGLEDGSLDELLLEVINEKKDLIIKENNIIYQITSSFNQDNNDYKNITIIKLDKFESIIKEKYDISKNDSLIIFKVEKYKEGFLIPLIEYEIYHPKTKKKLNLNFYNDLNISPFIYIYIPVFINENILYKYNLNSSYYNDVCHITETEDKVDIALYDRKNEFINKNLSLCPINCIFIGYDFNNKISICKCEVQGDIILLLKNTEEKILSNIKNEKRKLNLNIMKCYQFLFLKGGLNKNIGFYINLIILILYIFLTIVFYLKGYDLLCNQINELLNNKNQNIQNHIFSNKDSKIREKDKDNLSDIFAPSSYKNVNISDIKSSLKFNTSKDILTNSQKNINKKKEIEVSIEYIESEINNIPYEKALENDKRTFFQYYISLLKTTHIIIFAFFPTKDYNSFIIKICLLLFSFALFFAINTLFFNDSMMHKIYFDKGAFNLIYILPQSIYCVIICSINNYFLKRLSLSRKNILELKYETNKYNLKARTVLIIKRIIIKFIIFFIITILLLFIFLYYSSCFCYIYKNTQLYLIRTTLISYSLSIIYQFIICLIPTIIRIPSLKNPAKYIYKISLVIQ